MLHLSYIIRQTYITVKIIIYIAKEILVTKIDEKEMLI